MPEPSNRIRHDLLGIAEASVRCSCAQKGTIAILSLSHFLKIGPEKALALADSLCPVCSPVSFDYGDAP